MPPSNHFEKLRGNLEGFRSIRVNKQWRLIFQWMGAEVKQSASIWTIIVIFEVSHVDDKAQAGKRWRNSE